MVVGLGIDLVELERVARLQERWGDRLVRRLMDPEEAGRLPPGAAERIRALAEAITCKEAASKAIGTGWSRGVHWRQVVVQPGEGGPRLELQGEARQRARRLGSASGRTRTAVEQRGDLMVARVWLLA